jgi:hypothetical protein
MRAILETGGMNLQCRQSGRMWTAGLDYIVTPDSLMHEITILSSKEIAT